MPYKISFSEVQGALRVDVSGDRSLDGSLDLWTRVGELSSQRKQRRILAVLNMTGTLSITQMYSLAANFKQFNLTPAHRLAIVDTTETSFPTNEFGSVVATNRGLPMRVFDNEKDALAWLGRD